MRERRKTRKRKSQREGNEKRRRDQKSHFRKGTRIRELERKETEKKKNPTLAKHTVGAIPYPCGLHFVWQPFRGLKKLRCFHNSSFDFPFAFLQCKFT